MNDFMTRLETLGRSWASWATGANLWCAALLVVCYALDRLLARRVGAGVRIALYAALAIRIAVPLDTQSPVGLASAAAPVVAQSESPPILSDLPLIFDAEPAPATTPAAITPGSTIFTWHAAVPIAWFGGAIAMIALIIRGRLSTAGLLREAVPTADHFAAATTARVVTHTSAGPMIVGTVRPVIVLPQSIQDRIDADQLAAILRHEAAHIQRRDPLLIALMQGALALLWPILPLWLAAARVRHLMEEACDERSLANADSPTRARYGQTLLDVAEWLPRRRSLAADGSLGFALGLRSRIAALRHHHRWGGSVQATVVGVLLTGIAACAAPRTNSDTTYQVDHGRGEQGVDKIAGARAAGVPMPNSTVTLTFKVLDSWPKHPALDFDVRQTSGDLDTTAVSPKTDRSSVGRTLDDMQVREVLAALGASGGQVLSSPSLRVTDGQTATIRMGHDDQGKMKDGFELIATPTKKNNAYAVSLAFQDFGNDEKNTHTLTNCTVNIPDGRTAAVLITPGLIGGSYRMILVSVESGTEPAKSRSSVEAFTYPAVSVSANLNAVDGSIDPLAAIANFGAMEIAADKLPEGVTLHMMPEEHFTKANDRLREMKGWQVLTVTHVFVGNRMTVPLGPSSKGGGALPRELATSSVNVRLEGNAAKSEGDLGGSLAVGGLWDIHDGRIVNIPPTVLQNYEAAAHHMMLVAIARPKSGPTASTRIFFLRPSLIRNDAALPRQTLSTGMGGDRNTPTRRLPAPPPPGAPK